MQEQAQPQQNQQGQQQQGQIPFEVRYFDAATYVKVFHTHVNIFQLFVSHLSQKGVQVDATELSSLLNSYWENYIKSGDNLSDLPEGATCQHVFTKGAAEKKGTMCGATAKYRGVEGKPKCTTHKNSRPVKDGEGTTSSAGGVPSPSKTNPVFNYKDHKNTGTVSGQSLTSLQNSIKEQVTPSQINLTRNEHGIVYNPDTRLVFTQKEDGLYYAIGILGDDGKSVNRLANVDTYLCYSNGWKWDETCVDENDTNSEHPLMEGLIGAESNLVSNQSAIIKAKINSFSSNNPGS